MAYLTPIWNILNSFCDRKPVLFNWTLQITSNTLKEKGGNILYIFTVNKSYEKTVDKHWHNFFKY